MASPTSGEFRAVCEQIAENRVQIERIEEENRHLRQWVIAVSGIMGRITGRPLAGAPGDELAARRRRRAGRPRAS